MKKRVYYAHPMSWYDTPEEYEDVKAIAVMLDAKVINPNTPAFETRVSKARTSGYPVMQIFADTIRNDIDALCFRRFKDGKLGAGVAREIFEAKIWGVEVWEIMDGYNGHPFAATPYGLDDEFLYDTLTVEETKRRVAARQL